MVEVPSSTNLGLMKTEAWTRSTLAAIHRNSVSPAYPLATAMLGRQKRTRTNDCELRRFICYPPRLEQQKCFQASDRKGVMRTIEDSRASKQRTRVGRSELPPSLELKFREVKDIGLSVRCSTSGEAFYDPLDQMSAWPEGRKGYQAYLDNQPAT